MANVQDGFFNVFLGVGAFDELTFHHEIWHVMEYRIMANDTDAFADWADLNPEGFQYDGDYFAKSTWVYAALVDDWFVNRYSTADELEDRATIIEAIFDHDRVWWNDKPHLKAKRDKLMEAAEPIFGCVYFPE